MRFITGGIFVSDNWGQGMFFVGGILLRQGTVINLKYKHEVD